MDKMLDLRFSKDMIWLSGSNKVNGMYKPVQMHDHDRGKVWLLQKLKLINLLQDFHMVSQSIHATVPRLKESQAPLERCHTPKILLVNLWDHSSSPSRNKGISIYFFSFYFIFICYFVLYWQSKRKPLTTLIGSH